jgi:hypothetical protein
MTVRALATKLKRLENLAKMRPRWHDAANSSSHAEDKCLTAVPDGEANCDMLLRRTDMSLRMRLQRLEQNDVDAGCPACRDRQGRIALRIVERRPDGTLAAHSEELLPCVQCGEIPEQVVEVIETAVEPRTKSP